MNNHVLICSGGKHTQCQLLTLLKKKKRKSEEKKNPDRLKWSAAKHPWWICTQIIKHEKGIIILCSICMNNFTAAKSQIIVIPAVYMK